MLFLSILLTLSNFIVRSAASCCSLNDVVLGGTHYSIDLTIPHDNETVYFKIDEKKSEEYRSPPVVMLGGTYFEAPSSYYEKGALVTGILAADTVIQLLLIDVSSKVNDNPKYVLRKSDIHETIDHEILKTIDKYPTLVIIKFGWSKFYNDKQKYLGHTEESTAFDFPTISNEIAEWIASYDRVVGLGVDLPNIERDASEGFPVHKTLGKAGIYVIENLNLTSTVPTHECTVGAFPIRRKGKSRAPGTVLTVCPQDSSQCQTEPDKKKEQEHKQESKHKHKKCMHCHHHAENHEHKHEDKEPEKQENKEPEKQENKEPEKQENKEPPKQENKEPPKQENKEPPKQENKEPHKGPHKYLNKINKIFGKDNQ